MKPFRARFFTAMSYPAPERCFRNRLLDSGRSHQPSDSAAAASASPISDGALLRLQSPPAILSDNFLSAALHLKDEVVQATWSNTSATPRKNLSIYTGTLGTAFLCFRAYQATGNLQDLHLCRDIIQACSAASASMRRLGLLPHCSKSFIVPCSSVLMKLHDPLLPMPASSHVFFFGNLHVPYISPRSPWHFCPRSCCCQVLWQ